MQATITYLLTEQAQRAQMVATGQPVARKQTVTIEVPPEDLQYYDIAADGSIAVDLRGVTHLAGHRIDTQAFAEPPWIPDLVRAAIADEEAAQQKKQDALAQNLARQMSAVEQFMTDPTKRAGFTGQFGCRIVNNICIMEQASEYSAACPRYAEFPIPEDPRQYAEKSALNATVPAVNRDDRARGPGTSPASRTRAWNLEIGACGKCGRTERLVTATLCADCLVKHNAWSRALKARLKARGVCVNCGKKNDSNTSTTLCSSCLSKYRRYRREQGTA